MLEVKCLFCGTKIADYSGELGYDIPIESKFYTRVDGSQPPHGSTTAHQCPGCEHVINELEATLHAIDNYLNPASKRAQTEQYLTEKGNVNPPDRSA